jgi:putative N6-adenine-specific DNA methylase
VRVPISLFTTLVSSKTFDHAFAIVAPGLAPIVAGELRALGIEPEETESGGVSFRAAPDQLYAANLWLRAASRIVVRVGRFHASAFYELEKRARRVPWADYLEAGQPVRLRVTCRKSKLYHSDAVAERVSAAIARVTGGPTSNESGEEDVDGTEDVSALVIVRIVHDECTLSVDSSGALLHRRGYRLASGKAPMRETLAAAMLIGVGWDGAVPLLDPFCGAGTIPIEAALLARRRAPGLAGGRSFAFMRWPTFDEARWGEMVARARDGERGGVLPPIIASDRDAGATAATIANAERAGVASDIAVTTRAMSMMDVPHEHGWIVTNPPYGVRVGDRQELRDLYAKFGHVVRTRCVGWRVAMVAGDRALAGATQLQLTPRLRTVNGGIPVTVLEGAT